MTKKRDLSQRGQWVANERIEHPITHKSYAIIMPPREQELWEDRQSPHIHLDPKTASKLGVENGAVVTGRVRGTNIQMKIKVDKNFIPRAHFDDVDADLWGIKTGDEIEV